MRVSEGVSIERRVTNECQFTHSGCLPDFTQRPHAAELAPLLAKLEDAGIHNAPDFIVRPANLHLLGPVQILLPA